MQNYDIFKFRVEEAVIVLNQYYEKLIEQEETKEIAKPQEGLIRQQRNAEFPKHLRLLIYSYLDLKKLVSLRNLSWEEKKRLESSEIISEGKIFEWNFSDKSCWLHANTFGEPLELEEIMRKRQIMKDSLQFLSDFQNDFIKRK